MNGLRTAGQFHRERKADWCADNVGRRRKHDRCTDAARFAASQMTDLAMLISRTVEDRDAECRERAIGKNILCKFCRRQLVGWQSRNLVREPNQKQRERA